MKQEFRLVIESPYGEQPIEQFRHFINKVSDEALTRWGISIEVESVTEQDDVDRSEFE